MDPEQQQDEGTNEVPDRGDARAAELRAIPYYTYIFLALIGAVFIAQYLTSYDPDFFLVDRVSGANAGFDKQRFLGGEFWRLFTGTLIHSGVLHVGMNCYALYSFGRLIELLSNRSHLAIIFVLSALGGDILSLIFNPDGVSVGASGGIVGFLSYLAVYAFKRRQFISAEFRKSLLLNIGFILVFGLVLFNVVDNYGHVGGLIVGAIYGLLQIPRDEYTDPRQASRLTKLVGYAAILLYVVTSIVTVLILVQNNLPNA